MNPWKSYLDSQGNPHACTHMDGHRVALFPEGWWAYHRDYRWTPPRSPMIGPAPQGPFLTLDTAKAFVEAQGFTSAFPYEQAPQTFLHNSRI